MKCCLLGLLFGFLFHPLLSAGQNQPIRLWVDTDIMIGKFGKDVDDGLALIALLNSPNVEIVGISLTQRVKHGLKVTKKTLKMTGNEHIPIFIGAKDSSERGMMSDAVLALADALSKEPLTIAVLGPVTNISSLLLNYPELEDKIEELYYCGGRTPGLVFLPEGGKYEFSDYNFELDVASVEHMLATDIPLVLGCYEPASYIQWGKSDISIFKEAGIEGGRWLFRQCNSWRRIWKVILRVEEGFMPFDAVAMGYYLAPEFMEIWDDAGVEIRRREVDFEENEDDYLNELVVHPEIASEQRVVYILKLEEGYSKFLLDLLSGNGE